MRPHRQRPCTCPHWPHQPGGLPIGAQLIGGWHDEHRLLDLASALEEA